MNFWTIYFVMQADTIHGALWAVFSIAALLVLSLSLCIAFTTSLREFDEERKGCIRLLKRWGWLMPILFTLAALMPSTKTLATALIIPAIVNNETLQKEAGELYGVAKDAIKGVLTPDGKVEPKKEVKEEKPVEELHDTDHDGIFTRTQLYELAKGAAEVVK
jgi:hypothetical protein